MLSVAAVVAVLGLQIVAVVRHWLWYTALLIIFLLRYVNLVEHNHVHLRIFRQAALNEFLGWMCFLSNGVPLEFYEIHHVRNHHRFNQRFDKHEQDWSSLYGFSGTCFPEKPIGLFYYILTFPVLTVCHCLLAILRKPGSRIFLRFARSIPVV